MEKTIKRLVYLLQQIVRDAGYAIINEEGEASRRFCIGRYNRIYERLLASDRALASHFAPLPLDSSPGIVRMAARDMAGMLKEHLRQKRRQSTSGCLWETVWSFFEIKPV